MDSTDIFCQQCLRLLQNIRACPHEGKGFHHQNFTAYRQALDHNCAICKRFERENEILKTRQNVDTFNLSYRYEWERLDADWDPGFASGLPEKTVQVILNRDDVDESEYSTAFLNLVPISSTGGTLTIIGKHYSLLMLH